MFQPLSMPCGSAWALAGKSLRSMSEGPFWVPTKSTGRLAIVPRPRGGDWLARDVRIILDHGFDVVASLLTDSENHELELQDEAGTCRQFGLEFISFQVPDREVPDDRQRFREVAAHLATRIENGRSVAVHCRQGIGRSSLLAAAALATLGIDIPSALSMLQKSRGCPVPDTEQQRSWLESLYS